MFANTQDGSQHFMISVATMCESE